MLCVVATKIQMESVATDAVMAVESKQDELDKMHARCKQLLGSAAHDQQLMEVQSQLQSEQVYRSTLTDFEGTG